MLVSSVTGLLPPLQAVGLFVDIIGALVIAAPDVPYLNKHTRGGKLREARTMLPVGLTDGMLGYSAFIEELEKYSEEIDPRPAALSVDSEVGSKWDYIHGQYVVEGSDTMEAEKLSDVPYFAMRIHMHDQIKESEGRIRSIGFGILALGFSIQILSLL